MSALPNSTGMYRRRFMLDHSADKMLSSTLFKRNYAMLAAVFGAGFVFEIGFNSTMDKFWDSYNRGPLLDTSGENAHTRRSVNGKTFGPDT
ncbi:hypothetical protein CP533_4078 [Ophiocordyceps camponoti-saundersi (nom. inval.)]|nr:hypothetical protein CP533_4078 [Ophiocordyceps camponoti-saundersi (nom. inval.)]